MSMSGERSTPAMLVDHISRCPCSWYVIQLYGRIVHVLEEFVLEAGATKGRDLWLEFRRIRSGASRGRHANVVWLDFVAPLRHIVDDVTVTTARTNSNIPRIDDRLPLPGILASRAQQGELDADLRTSALLSTPSVQLVRDYYPLALEDEGRLAPMAAELVPRRAILVVVRCFLDTGDAHSRSLRSVCYVCVQHFVC
jgi:hypothetical protein